MDIFSKLRERSIRAQSSNISSFRTRNGTLAVLSSSSQNINTSSGVNRLNGGGGDVRGNKQLRRCDSAIALTGTWSSENNGSNLSTSPMKRQGTDYLVECGNGVLSIYGQGALRHALTVFFNTFCT